MGLTIVFCCKNLKVNTGNNNQRSVFTLFLLMIQVIVLLQNNAILFPFGVIKRLTYFSRTELCFQT